MNLKDLTVQQQQALLDLAILAMYADAHLASAEDERIVRLLTAMGVGTDYDRAKQYDAAIGRVSRNAESLATARGYITSLAQVFTTREQRRAVLAVLDDLITSDNRIVSQEKTYYATVREVFQM